MGGAIRDLTVLLRSMEPVWNEGVYAFATVSDAAAAGLDWRDVVASIREREGLSVVMAEPLLRQYGLTSHFRAAWITLNVHSDLAAVGLTAAFAAALGEAQISCNVVAGNCHDHIFVPYGEAEAAMAVLRRLQQAV
ncbi:ACT domain-containing protein [Neisseria leonii]|uniref:ACT domain-containing protein n=1 Tax=Neisseria leonii TaxID=2995413 RepID=UPI00237A39C0|nr:ACT domain-containing protein [Neisseria sp. 3986]MDD9326020.1 ACT domain-containing protein [Neisseria sp. 3986]